ncbi:hypothetical protein HZS_3262 [Henneguya salminicola]|nr:hypothetical protein HZS_3262 [Henneguya salminicola]
MDARYFINSTTVPDQLKESNKGDSYIRFRRTLEPQVQYKRSDGAWVGVKQRIENLTQEELELENTRMQMQMAVNKFNKNTFNTVLKELIEIQGKTEDTLLRLIESIFISVTRSGAWIKEFAQLCLKFWDSLKGNKTLASFFKTKLIDVFLKGTEISPEWIENYEKLKNQKIVTIEQLDEMNEELQFLERVQRTISIGSCKFLAHLYLCSFVTIDDSISCIKKLFSCAHDMNSEVICAYLTLVGHDISSIDKKREFLNKMVASFSERRLTCSMRVQFIIDDLLKLHKQNWVLRTKPGMSIKNVGQVSRFQSMVPDRNKSKGSQAKDSSSFYTNKTKFDLLSQKSENLIEVVAAHMNKHSNKREPTNQKPSGSYPNINVRKPIKTTTGPVLDHKAIKSFINPILSTFREISDNAKFVDDIKHNEISSSMDKVVNYFFEYIASNTSINYLCFGKLLLYLSDSGHLTKQDFLEGLIEFNKNFEDFVIDFPRLSNAIARCVLPLITSNTIDFNDYYQSFVTANFENPIDHLYNLFDELLLLINTDTAVHLWRQSKQNRSFKLDIEQKYNFLVDTNYVPQNIVKFDSIRGTYILSKTTVEYLSNLFKTDLNEFNNYLAHFCKLVYYCCPSSSSNDIDSFMLKTIQENKFLFSKAVSLYESFSSMYATFKNIFHVSDEEALLSVNFISRFTTTLTKENYVDFSVIKEMCSRPNNKIFIGELS